MAEALGADGGSPHCYCWNGRFWSQVARDPEEARRQLDRSISRLDGVRHYSFIISPLPVGRELDDIDLREDLPNFLQCAGSADRMLVELSRLEDGARRQFAVGHDPADDPRFEWTDVLWDCVSVRVQEREVLTSAEAVPIFHAYYETGAVPPAYALRLLDLPAPPS